MYLLILLIILLLLSGLLFTSFYLEIDSIRNLFRLRFGRMVRADLSIKESLFKIDLYFLGIPIKIDPYKGTKKAPGEIKQVKTKKKVNINFRKIMAVLKSFRVKEFYMNIDTGNEQSNGMLFPVFLGLSYISKRNISINFIDQNDFKLIIQNNAARVAWAYFRN